MFTNDIACRHDYAGRTPPRSVRFSFSLAIVTSPSRDKPGAYSEQPPRFAIAISLYGSYVLGEYALTAPIASFSIAH